MGDSFAELSKSVHEDKCKKLLLISKYLLQPLSLWPEIQTIAAKILSSMLLLNQIILLIFHSVYMILVINDLAEMAEVFTTVNVIIQSLIRMTTIIYYRKEFAIGLQILWKEFLPLKTLNEKQQENIDGATRGYKFFLYSFLIGSSLSCSAFVHTPDIVTNKRLLPIALWTPFSSSTTPNYEIVYVWCFLSSHLGILIPFMGFDALYSGMVYNCSVQFKILRHLFSDLVKEGENKTKEEQTELLMKYLKYHQLLIKYCDMLKHQLQYTLLLQLMQNAFALCFCCFAGMTVPSVMLKMFIFANTYVLQLFLYCTFGNELTHQSQRVAYAVFSCGWHFTDNEKLTKLLIPVIQKAQKGEVLSASGFTAVNHASFITVLRMAFSFFTLLRKIMDKRR